MTDSDSSDHNDSNHNSDPHDHSAGGTPLRHLPGIDRLLKDSAALDLINNYGRQATRDALRVALDAARQWIRQGGVAPLPGELIQAANTLLRTRQTSSLRAVINATGVVLHTNLGRAPLSDSAQQAILAVATGYSTLEYELDEGKRGKRDHHIETQITAITGAEAALVVNNNTSALMLITMGLALDREVIISRGQLIEIGGGFRLPEIMINSGARLVEVGTTNRTNLDDFSEAVTPQAAMLLYAHTSNFKQIGFTEQPEMSELAAFAQSQNLISVADLGSGAMLDTAAYGLDHEPMVQEALKAGMDLVVFSGDKLLGGPQAGVIVGRSKLIDKLKRHPLARAVRIDKLCLAALHATLEHYKRGDAVTNVPVWQMIAVPIEAIRARTEEWAQQVGGEVIRSESTVGGGSLPGDTLPTYVLALDTPNPDDLAARLRRHHIPVIARIARNRVLLDPRTVLPGQDAEVIRALESVLAETAR
jgi:L-seryl-tRNA(Ser) seleniumtransferase